MRIPRRIADILKKKDEYLDAARSKLESSVVRSQSRLLADVLKELIPELDIKDGVIQETAKNYRLISSIDKIYKGFASGVNPVIADQIVKATGKIAELSVDYFKIVLSGDLPARFDKVVTTANELIDLRIGLKGGKFIRGGFLESFFNSNTIGTELKEMTSKAVSSGMDRKEFIDLLRDKITGVDQKAGVMERQYQRFAYDLYQQYDAAYNKTLGNEFGFKYFIYQGGLIKDSRDFCAAHNNKVWSVEEAKEWPEWTPSKGEYPAGYEIKQKDVYAVPSYMGYPGYDPLIDRGGYNCRHSLGWIPDDLAFKMRPELAE